VSDPVIQVIDEDRQQRLAVAPAGAFMTRGDDVDPGVLGDLPDGLAILGKKSGGLPMRRSYQGSIDS
jgi:hypothetical protein